MRARSRFVFPFLMPQHRPAAMNPIGAHTPEGIVSIKACSSFLRAFIFGRGHPGGWLWAHYHKSKTTRWKGFKLDGDEKGRIEGRKRNRPKKPATRNRIEWGVFRDWPSSY